VVEVPYPRGRGRARRSCSSHSPSSLSSPFLHSHQLEQRKKYIYKLVIKSKGFQINQQKTAGHWDLAAIGLDVR
jgi:hypothetical protein